MTPDQLNQLCKHLDQALMIVAHSEAQTVADLNVGNEAAGQRRTLRDVRRIQKQLAATYQAVNRAYNS